jgi:hypothetical protein
MIGLGSHTGDIEAINKAWNTAASIRKRRAGVRWGCVAVARVDMPGSLPFCGTTIACGGRVFVARRAASPGIIVGRGRTIVAQERLLSYASPGLMY